MKELAQHHVGGYLKIAPEAIAEGPLSKMMKPGVGTYDRFKELFDKYSKEAGKEQYLIPYFIAAHPGTRDEDMLELALWLKRNGFRADQVQAFLPSPMATATAMYHSGKNPLHKVTRTSEDVVIPKGTRAAPAAQGVPALSRSEQLAAAARGAAADGALRPDRQRPQPAGADLPADRHGSCPRRQAQARKVRGVAAEIAAEAGGESRACTAVPHPAHGVATRADRGAAAPAGFEAQTGPLNPPGTPAG